MVAMTTSLWAFRRAKRARRAPRAVLPSWVRARRVCPAVRWFIGRTDAHRREVDEFVHGAGRESTGFGEFEGGVREAPRTSIARIQGSRPRWASIVGHIGPRTGRSRERALGPHRDGVAFRGLFDEGYEVAKTKVPPTRRGPRRGP